MESVKFKSKVRMVSIVRISALSWADMFAGFAMYVMMNYLTDVWNLTTIHAAGILNIWDGITQILPFLLTILVDTFMGDYHMLVVSSIAYTLGLGLLSLSTPPVFGSCKEYKAECIGHTQKVLFFTALALIALGVAGQQVSLTPFIELQQNGVNNEEEGKGNKGNYMSRRQIVALAVMSIVRLAGTIGLPYINPWSIRFTIASVFTLVTTILFFSGYRVYKRSNKPAEGSPLTSILRVFVACFRNISQTVPADPKQLFNEDDVQPTTSLRFLEKAAIKLPAGDEHESSKWKLCSVREVEETKIHMRMVPMWLTFIVIGIVLSIGNTYFLDQANQMDRKVGKVKVPIEIFLVLFTLASSISKYDYRLVRDSMPKKYAPPVGIAHAMLYSILCCITAAKVEGRRLDLIRDNGVLDKPDQTIPMSMLWLVPQVLLLGSIQGTASISITNFFIQQAPESMHKYLAYIISAVQGLGTMLSVLMVHIVGKVSERNQKPNWFQPTLNESHFDRYYWTLAALSTANLFVYILISRFYNYDDKAQSGKIHEDVEDANL